MIVRYARERGYKGLGQDPLLTIGCDYIVLGILFRPDSYANQVCIQTNKTDGDHSDGKPYTDGGPGLFDIGFFDVIDSRLPPGWSLVDAGRGYYRLDPNEFGGDFWDHFHDADPDSEKTFNRIIERLKEFHVNN